MGVIVLREKNGAGEVATPKAWADGVLRFRLTDEPPVDDTGELVKPAGTSRSYEKWLRLYMAVAPAGTLSSPVLYVVGTLPVGVTLYACTTNPSAFSTPGIPANDSAGVDATTYTSASPKALDVANAGPFSTAGADFGDYLVLWLTITSSVVIPSNARGQIAVQVAPYFRWTET